MINIVAYKEGTTEVKTERQSEKINIQSGVAPGVVLYPRSYSKLVSEDIFKRTNPESGINNNGNNSPS